MKTLCATHVADSTVNPFNISVHIYSMFMYISIYIQGFWLPNEKFIILDFIIRQLIRMHKEFNASTHFAQQLGDTYFQKGCGSSYMLELKLGKSSPPG